MLSPPSGEQAPEGRAGAEGRHAERGLPASGSGRQPRQPRGPQRRRCAAAGGVADRESVERLSRVCRASIESLSRVYRESIESPSSAASAAPHVDAVKKARHLLGAQAVSQQLQFDGRGGGDLVQAPEAAQRDALAVQHHLAPRDAGKSAAGGAPIVGGSAVGPAHRCPPRLTAAHRNRCCAVLRGAARCCAVLRGAARCCAMLHDAAGLLSKRSAAHCSALRRIREATPACCL